MLNENRINIKPVLVLVFVNLFYLFLLIIDSVESVFTLWLFALFISLTPILLKDRRNMIAVIVFLIPFEISKTFIPFFQTIEIQNGMFNSVFDLARLFMLYSFILWFITDLKSFVPLVKHRISYILIIFIFYYFLSTLAISPDLSKGLNETLRYTIYFLFFTMIIQFIKKPEDFKLIFKILIIVAVVLSLEGIAEYIFDYRLWVDKGRRAAATFLDPNIFARFLDIVIILLVVFRLKKIHIIKPQYMDISILLCGIALLLTISRQGWFILFITMFLVSFYMDKKNRKILIIGLLILSVISAFILVSLLETREQGLELYDIGTRAGLLLGGLLMFTGSPIYGIGAGGFQAVMIERYLEFLPWGINSATISHTYVMTILAELGVIGITIFILMLIFIYKQFKINFNTENMLHKIFSIIIFAAIIVVFIGAQAEGRFFEEPFLWLFLGLHVALGNIADKKNDKLST